MRARSRAATGRRMISAPDRARVEQALYGRIDPQLQIERSNIEQRLADQGIRYGSQAYGNAMMDYSRQANDARLAVTQTAGQEQQRMMEMAAQRAAFQNQAQSNAFQQMAMRGRSITPAAPSSWPRRRRRSTPQTPAVVNISTSNTRSARSPLTR